jgi:D-3-phosphoglycerate dehydrogenase
VILKSGAGVHSAEGTIFGKGDPRLVSIDGRSLEFRPRGVALYVLNRDVPGVVGLVGTILGAAGVNIADFTLSRGDGSGGAASVLTVDTVPPPKVLASLEAAEAIEQVRVVEW